jgi:hypothetical protein
MALIASLASRLAQVALVGPAIARLKRKAIRSAIGGALIALFGILALVYLLAALRTALEREIGPLWAPVAIGGGLLVLAGIAYLAFLRPRGAEREAAASQADAMRDRIAGPARAIEGQVTQRPLQSLAIALAVGFAGATLLRMLRGGRTPSLPPRYDGYGAPPPHPMGAERPAGMREVVLRETDRRKGNGRHP